MNVLVIGGTRFVGYLLTWRLMAAGHRVTLFNRGNHPDPFGDRVERLRGDRTTADFSGLLGGREFDAAVDLAAYTGDDAVSAVSTLLGRVGHYVFISTGQVYLVKEGCALPAREEEYEGPVRPEPGDPEELTSWRYGVDKRAAEDHLAWAYAERSFSVTRLRIPMVNGERDYYRRIESYLWRILDGGPLVLPDGGTQICRHVYSGEVARAVAGLLGDSTTFGDVFNLSQDEQVTVAELVARLARLLGAEPELVAVPAERLVAEGIDPREISPFSGRWMSRLDASRARRRLGFQHEPLERYLEKIVAAFLAHPPSDRPEGYRHRPAEIRLAAEGL